MIRRIYGHKIGHMAKELELSKNNIKILHVKNKEAKKNPCINQLLIPIIDNSTKLIKVLSKKKKKKEIRLSKADFLKKQTKTKYESSRNISPTTNYIRTCKPTPQNITNLSSIKIIANAI